MSENSTGFRMNEPAEGFDDESLFAELKAEAEKSIERAPLVLAVERRPGWAVEYSGELTQREMLRLMKRARLKGTGKPGQEDIDAVKFSATILASLGTQMLRVIPGTDTVQKRLTDGEGDPAGLTTEEFLKSFSENGDLDSVSAITRFMGESGVNAHGAEVLKWQGLDEEAERLNPTNG